MAQARQYIQDTQINNGTTASSNIKMTDVMPIQHTDVASNVNQINKVNIAQTLCEPVAVCNSNNPANGAYTATCLNFPDFALSYTDSQGTSHNLIGMKVRVVFNYGITYGSVSGGTYPTLNINGSGAIPLLAQGKTMATGACSAGQTVEFTVIPYGNGLAYDADSNIRESTSGYTIYTDGLKRVDTVEDNNKNMVTSNAVSTALKNTLIPNTQLYNVSGYYKFKHRQIYGRTSNFKVIMGLNVIELVMYKADSSMVVSAFQEGKTTAETTFQLGYDNTYLYIKKTTNASPGYSIQAYSLTNAYEPIGTLEVSNQTEFDNSTKINISDYENKATLWENTLISICNVTVLQAGKEVSFTVNTTSIADLPVANSGIVTTRKNILGNRAIQMYFCNESTNNDIYYRYLEWNGSYWSSAIGWKKIQSVAI